MGDLSDIFAGVSVATAVAAIFGAGALVVAVGFASWLTDLVASFFDSGEAEEAEEGYYAEGWEEDCQHCGYTMDQDDAIYAHNTTGVCPKCGEAV